MAIKLPAGLPAGRILREEGVDVFDGTGALFPGARPLRVALLNLMPTKADTEVQIARLLGSSGRPIELTLLVPDSYRSRTTPAEHLAAFYSPWSHVREQWFDGLIVTGAPVETLPFEDVRYWTDLTEILDWAQHHVYWSYHICWAAQAALYHAYGVPKHGLDEKVFGVFEHRIGKPGAALMRGLRDPVPVPVSRHTEVRAGDLPCGDGLDVLMESDEAGLCLIEDTRRRAVYMFNHLEYDAGTLAREYRRDLAAGRRVALPRHYFPGDDPDRPAVNRWRPQGRVLFRNWIDRIALGTPSVARSCRVADWPPIRRWGNTAASAAPARHRWRSWHGALL